MRWPEGEGRAANAPYAIVHADGVYHERRDQRAGGGEWSRLGGGRLFRLLPGRTAGVILTNEAEGTVVADAVRFVLRTRLG